MKSIAEDPTITQTAIAENVFKDNASVTRMINILVKNKFLDRKIDPNNRRRFLLNVTDLGMKELTDMHSVIENYRAKALKGISKEEVIVLQNLMDKITSNCNEDGGFLKFNILNSNLLTI